MRYVWWVSRLVFGALFVYAGAAKMADGPGFAAAVFNYQLLPSWAVYWAAMALPAIEVVCGLALCVNALSRGAAVILNVLMAGFIGVQALAMSRGLNVTCGCFGGPGEAVTRETLIRDGVILAVGLIALWGAAFAGAGEDEL